MPVVDFGGVGRRFTLWLAAIAGGVLALIVSAAFGLLDIRSDIKVPKIAPGQAVDAGRWRVVVERAWVASKLPDGHAPPAGARALVIEARITNLTQATSNAFYDLFRLAQPASGFDPKPTLYLERDRDLLEQLHPRLTETVAVAWTLPASIAPPSALTLALQGETYKQRDNLYAAAGWFTPHLVARIDLPIEQRENGG